MLSTEITKSEYQSIHSWIRYRYGKASKCEDATCTGKSKNYAWALRKGFDYARNKENFMELCYSCHGRMDCTEEKRLKMSKSMLGRKRSPEAIEKTRRARLGSKQPNNVKQNIRESLYKPVEKLGKDGAVIGWFPSMQHAAEENGVQRESISSAIRLNRMSRGYRYRLALTPTK